MAKLCKATTKSGQPCNANALEDLDFCVFHDPEMQQTVTAARQLGGFHRRRGVSDAQFPRADTKSLDGLLTIIDAAIRETWLLENSTSRARALGYLAAAQAKILEVADVERRLAALEEKLK